MKIAKLIELAYSEAKKTEKLPDRKKTNVARARNWIRQLAFAFGKEYAQKSGYEIFIKYSKPDDSIFIDQKERFGLHEYLFDLSVCKATAGASAKGAYGIPVIQECIWQVESEFSSNSREAAIDFNKLVMGSAKHKLFIAPPTHDNLLRGSLLQIAKFCSGRVFLAEVPHPDDWEIENKTKVFLFKQNNWVECPDECVDVR